MHPAHIGPLSARCTSRRGSGDRTRGNVYLALYVPIWWAWVGFVLHTDRFGTDDISDRFMTLLQIGAVLVIAAAASEATADRASAFAAAYATFRLLLAVRYAIAAYYVREARPECARQAAGFAFASLIWIASAAVPAPWRFWMWGAGLAVDLATPFASPRVHQIVPPDAKHIEERFGTFINISLGEGFVALVEAMRDQRWSGAMMATSALSLVIGFAIWWGFFDDLDKGPIEEVRKSARTGPFKMSAVEVAGILAAASGVQVLWTIWNRARTDLRTGEDPGPGLASTA